MPFADPAVAAEYRRRYYAEKYQTDPEFRQRREDQRLRRIHDLTQDELDALRVRAKGRCELCGVKLKRPVIDHDHETGRVRGIVCFNCNTGLRYVDRLGWFDLAQQFVGRTT